MNMRVLLFIILVGVFSEAGWAQSEGYLRMVSNRDSLHVVFAPDVETDLNFGQIRRIASGDSLRLPGGRHKLMVTAPGDEEIVAVVSVPAGGTAIYRFDLMQIGDADEYLKRSSYPRIQWDATLMVLTPQTNRVFVNGIEMGSGSMWFELAKDTYTVRVDHPSGRTTRRKVAVRGDRLRVLELHTQPVRTYSRVLGVLPGVSQVYKREWVKAGLFLSGAAVTGGLAWKYERRLEIANRQLQTVRASYQAATTEQQAVQLYEEVTALQADADSFHRQRVLWGALAAGIYLANLFDAFQAPKGGFRLPGTPTADVVVSPVIAPDAVGVRFNF